MESIPLALPTLFFVVVYVVGLNVLGVWLGRGQKDARDYFLGGHAMPWWAVLASIVATETSALTFLSVPGDAYRSGYTFLQLVLGYIAGRVAVSFLLLPGYFQCEIPTAYALLETRFGVRTRRLTSLLFLVTRALAAAVRLAVPAIPIALLLHIPVWAAILVLASGTTVYTLFGGIKADIWIDSIQMFQYLTASLVALFFLLDRVPGGLGGAFAARAATGDPVRFFDFAFDPSRPYTFWSGLVGGAFLAMASHGADQLIVQRLLACRGLRDARRALIGSGLVVFAQMSVFTTIGVLLFTFFGGRSFATPDEIFPSFMVRELPPWVSAYLVAGIFSAAMCSESSARNSLASALALDLVGPLTATASLEGRRGLYLGRALTLFWTVALAALAIGFSLLPMTEPSVQVALSLASVTAGGLLGAFLLARFAPRVRETDLLWAIFAATAFLLLLWLGSKGWIDFPLGQRIAWPWYSLLGAASTCAVALLLSARHRAGPAR
jgi:solute:Na+ symporter, SSS family